MRSTRHEGRRHAARGAPLHPGVPRQDGGDQVRRRGDERRLAQGGVRPRRGAAQVRGDEPDRRARRRPGDHQLHAAAGSARAVRGRTAGLQSRNGGNRQDGAGGQGQQGHRAAGQPPRGAGRGAVRRRRAAVSRHAPDLPQRPGHRVRGPDRASRRGPAQPRGGELHPDRGQHRRRPGGQLLQHQRRRGGGCGGARARRLQDHVPHRRARLAARPVGSGQRGLRGGRRGGRGRAGQRRRRHAPQAPGLPGRDPRRGLPRAHRRRAGDVSAAATHPAASLAELQALERRYAIPTYVRSPVQFVRGAGARLWDSDGHEYLDFLAGISVLNVGHCHPRVVAAVREQAARLSHVSNFFYTEPGLRLADSSLGGKVFFTNSGAEAIEAALKLARRARPGGRIVVVEGAFHGRTFGALSATPQESKQAPFAPLVPGFSAVAREPAALEAAVDERTAAVLLEPIQGESGINVLSDELLAAARAACDRAGAALIFDEIQCGMGRTGTLWAYQQTGVVPDALTAAKALGGGYPIGALITGPRLADVLGPGEHGSTFAGGPVICAAALVALELCSDPALLARVAALGRRLADGLRRLPYVREVRGRGLMLAIDLDPARDAGELAQRALLEQRLVLNATGPATIRLEPPLVVGEEEIEQALARLEALA